MSKAGKKQQAAKAAAAGAPAAKQEDVSRTRSYNPNMEYRRLGKTGLWISAVSLGGHWKRVESLFPVNGRTEVGWFPAYNGDASAFHRNRDEVVTRCIESGINFVDACCGGEVLAYAQALRHRRESMYLGYSWYEKETRRPEWRTVDRLLQGLDEGLAEANLEYVDLWRISALLNGQHTTAENDAMAEALEKGRKQGKVRFTGVSSHDGTWLRTMIEGYPEAIQVVMFPYPATAQPAADGSIFATTCKHDVGVFGIKPFASNMLFQGDSTPGSSTAEQDDRAARMAIRGILNNPNITAPIPGLITTHQVDNVVQAVHERRTLDAAEQAEFAQTSERLWSNVPEDYKFLSQWRQA